MRYTSILIALLFVINSSCQTPHPSLKIGDKAPELALFNPQGKKLSLSSYRGNLVLVDFWASWCGPCRRENATLVQAYSDYKEKIFTQGKKFVIFSVSLDKSPAAWEKAILDDGLSWTTHVSDFGGWQSKAAQIYGVNSIPNNFLVNDKGIIIDINLRGDDLAEKLNRLLR